jgi:ribosomal protein S21
VKRRRYFENTQDIKKRKQSARFKKVFRQGVRLALSPRLCTCA